MSISDNARERARIARLKALESEERVQNYGDLADSRVTVINYDPDKGYLVRALNGEVGYATNISGTQLGVGATVQATRKGNGFIIDYFDISSGKGNNSDSNGLSKEAFSNASSSTGFSGFGGIDPNNSVVGYKPDGQGGCDVKTYSKDKKLPEGVYATAKECQDSQKEGSFKCVNGKCVEVTDGSGKYKTKVECEAALLPATFTGGQCVNVIYVVNYFVLGQSEYVNLTGPINGVVKSASGNTFMYSISYGNNQLYTVLSAAGPSETVTLNSVTRYDGLPDNCGNPNKQCPP